MLSLPSAVRIYLGTQPADMRRSFDGLAHLVQQFLQGDPLSGHLFVFRNKAQDRRYVCGACGWARHRDAVGAINISRRTGLRGNIVGAAIA